MLLYVLAKICQLTFFFLFLVSINLTNTDPVFIITLKRQSFPLQSRLRLYPKNSIWIPLDSIINSVKRTDFFHQTYPLWVTRHCLRPSFRKISTTISIGVWSVTVKGLMSRMLRSFSGRGLSAGRDGVCCAKHTRELPTIPSCFFLALSEKR